MRFAACLVPLAVLSAMPAGFAEEPAAAEAVPAQAADDELDLLTEVAALSDEELGSQRAREDIGVSTSRSTTRTRVAR